MSSKRSVECKSRRSATAVRRTKVKAEYAGKRVKCRSCGGAFRVPEATGSLANDDLPLREVTPFDDDDLPTLQPLPQSPQVTTPTPTPLPSAYQAPPNATNSDSGSSSSAGRAVGDRRTIEIAAGVLSIHHGGSAVLWLVWSLQIMLRLRVFPPSSLFWLLLSAAISGGILAGGIGVLRREKWGLSVGAAASLAYFGLTLFAILRALRALRAGIFLGMIGVLIRGAFYSAGPALMLYLYQSDPNSRFSRDW